jgi:putative ABC transport system permease protein
MLSSSTSLVVRQLRANPPATGMRTGIGRSCLAGTGSGCDEGSRHAAGAHGGALLLTGRDMQYRATRFAAVVLGIAVVLALLFLASGLVEQFHREPRQTVDGFGADAWMLRDGASGAFTSAATMPAGTVALVDGVDAAPIILARHGLTDGGDHSDIVVVGFEAGALGEPRVTDGRLPAAPGEAVIDRAAGVDVGDTATVGDASYRVVGLTKRSTLFAGMPLLFMSLGDAQDLIYRGQPLATAVLLGARPPALPEGFTALTPSEIADDAMRPLERAIASVNIVRILLWLVAGLIIGTMTYLSALERRRDVAVLKAVGGSTGRIAVSIGLEGILIALVAALAGAGLQALLVPIFPLDVSVPARAFVQVPLIAVVVALLAGSVGLRRAIQVDPAVAFGGPNA